MLHCLPTGFRVLTAALIVGGLYPSLLIHSACSRIPADSKMCGEEDLTPIS